MPQQMNVPMPGEGAPLPTDSTAGNTSVENDPFDAALDAIEQQFLPQLRDKATDKATRRKLAKAFADKVDALIAVLGEDDDGAGGDDSAASASGQGDGDGSAMCNRLSNHSATAMIHPELIRLSSENRRMKIDRLRETGQITKPQHKQLVEKFTNSAAVGLALSNRANTSFEDTMGVLEQNTRLAYNEITGQQAIVLSNPLAHDAEAQKKAEEEEAARWRMKK